MKIALTRPLCFYDLETTGLDPATARIVSISLMKVMAMPDTKIIKYKQLINPGIPIPPESTAIHGITDEMVNAPGVYTFSQIAKKLYEFISPCDLAGYNNRYYDDTVLCEEFLRCGYDFPSTTTKRIDVYTIYIKNEGRTLADAYKFYCEKKLENAHDSFADMQATYEVFMAQLQQYDNLGKTVDEIDKYCEQENKTVDFAGKFTRDNDGDLVYTFGKSKGLKVRQDLSFAHWMLDKEFTLNTKNVLQQELQRIK